MKKFTLVLCTICCACFFLLSGCINSAPSNLAYQKKIDSLQKVAKKLEGQLDTYKSVLTFTAVPNDSISIMKYVEKYSTGPNRNLLITSVNSTDLLSIVRLSARSNDLKVLPVIPVAGNGSNSRLDTVIINKCGIIASATVERCGCSTSPGPPPPGAQPPGPPKLIIPGLNAEKLLSLFQGDSSLELNDFATN